jgi:hypothetical protein
VYQFEAMSNIFFERKKNRNGKTNRGENFQSKISAGSQLSRCVYLEHVYKEGLRAPNT